MGLFGSKEKLREETLPMASSMGKSSNINQINAFEEPEQIVNRSFEITKFEEQKVSEIPKTKPIAKQKAHPSKYLIKLENLLRGRESASVIDLKMGRNTITCNINSEERVRKRMKKDRVT